MTWNDERDEAELTREEARERLRASVDALAQQANLQLQVQKEPLKMLGGASAVGALMGVVIGRQFRRSRKIYVDAASPVKHQKALVKAQQRNQGKSVGGALVATLGTLAVKTLMDRVVTPRLEGMANQMLERAGQEGSAATKPGAQKASPAKAPASRTTLSAASFEKPKAAPPSTPASGPAQTDPEGPTPPAAANDSARSVQIEVAHSAGPEVKAKGSAIAPEELANPNQRL